MNTAVPLTEQEEFSSWVGKTMQTTDIVSGETVRRFSATFSLGPLNHNHGIAPRGLHWCMAPDIVDQTRVSEDGHPPKGVFLPPIPLPRRMWAGSKIEFHSELLIGDEVRCSSEIAAIKFTEGRSGPLCFVKVKRQINTIRGLAIEETQDLVYRSADDGSGPIGSPADFSAETPQWSKPCLVDPVLLFRYSALTFNGHRIHYDLPYATVVEGYPGLVVHGPLQATMLQHFAHEIKGAPPKYFSFRGIAPLTANNVLLIANETDEGLELSIIGAHRTTMQATAKW